MVHQLMVMIRSEYFEFQNDVHRVGRRGECGQKRMRPVADGGQGGRDYESGFEGSDG